MNYKIFKNPFPRIILRNPKKYVGKEYILRNQIKYFSEISYLTP